MEEAEERGVSLLDLVVAAAIAVVVRGLWA